MNRTNIFVAAWDEKYIKKFSDFTVPGLISKNNLPALSAERNLRFLFYTDKKSFEFFQDRIKILEQYGECCFHLFEDTMQDGVTIADRASSFVGPTYKHEIERYSQFHAIDKTLETGGTETLFFIPNDLLMTDGSMAYAQSKIDKGASSVLLPLLRLSFEASQSILNNFSKNGYMAKEICQNLQSILHPVSQRSFANSNEFINYPSAIIWPVDEIGWVARSFFPYLFASQPRTACRRFDSTMDYDYALNLRTSSGKIVIPKHSEEAFVAKVTTEEYLKIESKPNQLNLASLAHFILAETNHAHREIVFQPYRISGNKHVNFSTANWLEIEQKSLNFLNKVYKFLEVLRHELPADSIEGQAAIRSHFGDLSGYLSPMRRGHTKTGAK